MQMVEKEESALGRESRVGRASRAVQAQCTNERGVRGSERSPLNSCASSAHTASSSTTVRGWQTKILRTDERAAVADTDGVVGAHE